MAEEETKNNPKEMIEATPENLADDEDKSVEEIIDSAEKSGEGIKQEKDMSFEERRANREKTENRERLASWIPKTKLGRDVKNGKESSIDNVLKNRKKILESEIVDFLIKNLESDLISIGQAKGKFGGGKRRAWRQTQKKTKEGNVLTFSAMAVVGDKNGHVGLGTGKAKETLPAREKAVRKAKLEIIKVERGFEDPNDKFRDDPHTTPFIVHGKSGSVRVKLIPAPRGTGLVVGNELKKILTLAGIKDVYCVSKGHTRTTFNYVKACFDALNKTTKMIK